MSLEDEVRKNTEALSELTEVIKASLEGQTVAVQALTALLDSSKPIAAPVDKPKAKAEPKPVEIKHEPVEIKQEPAKEPTPMPMPEPGIDDLIVEEKKVSYADLVTRMREVAKPSGGRDYIMRILGKYGLKTLTEGALPPEKYADFLDDLNKFKGPSND